MKKIFYLGGESSYSHIVTKHVIFDKDYAMVPTKSFSEILENTVKTKHGIGVLPIENSITSDVHENIDYLFRTTNLQMLFEAYLRVKLHLVGFKKAQLTDIKTVYSHERALAQSSNFIKQYKLTSYESSSTSQARDEVVQKQDKALGIIGSKALADHPQLHIIQENIGNDIYNMTRFVFVGIDHREDISGTKNKASIIFTVPHMPGALAQLLTIISQEHINITKIESRPIPGTNWEYQFWIDIDKQEELSREKIETLFSNNTLSYKILGIYPKGNIFES